MNEQQLIEQGYRKYEGTGIDVYYSTDVCEHVGNCVRGSIEAFNPKRRPWIVPDAETPEETARIIETCPTKALRYIMK